MDECQPLHGGGEREGGHGHEGHEGHGHEEGDQVSLLRELMATLDLEDEDGNPVTAESAFEGKVVGLYFSAAHCPACVKFSPTLAALTQAHPSDLVTVLVSGRGLHSSTSQLNLSRV